MFSMVILCALLLGSICFYVRSIFLYFLEEIPYFIKKSHISDLTALYIHLEMMFNMNFY